MKPVSDSSDTYCQSTQKRKPVILAIEDNEDNLLLISYIAESLNCDFVGESEGSKTVEIAKCCQADIILLDIMLPGTNGLEIFASLQADTFTREIPVIAVTALALLEDQKRIEAAGFHGYVTKPYLIEELEEIVSRYLYLNSFQEGLITQ